MITGVCTYYAPDVMQQVAAYRGIDTPSGAALNDCTYIGAAVWIEWGPGEFTRHTVVDCAARQDRATRERQGRVAEVDAQTARRFGFFGVGPRWCGVWLKEPPQKWRAS